MEGEERENGNERNLQWLATVKTKSWICQSGIGVCPSLNRQHPHLVSILSHPLLFPIPDHFLIQILYLFRLDAKVNVIPRNRPGQA